MKKPLSCALGAFMICAGVAQAENVVDVLMLYTDEAVNTTNGRDIAARAATYIEYTNQAYRNSNVDLTLRLVGLENLDAGYTNVSGGNLDAFRNNSKVAALRQRYGADLVTLLNLRQPMSGGYLCGMGYLPVGNSSTGTLYGNASSLGFSMVGVDCGMSSFSHEVGHNMSLGHSYAQSEEGGIWSWARGHGVYGSFSTIMAYPHTYNTRNQIQQFSNPRQVKCEGQACGVDMNQTKGADSATNLNRLGKQIAAFVPQVNAVGGDGGDGGDGDLPICNKPELNDNLVTNGDFTELSGWESFSDAGQLNQINATKDCGKDILLKVTDRSAFYAGPFQTMTGKLQAGKEYRVSAKLGLGGRGNREDIRMALQIRDSRGFRYQYLPAVSVTSTEMSDYEQTFTVKSDDSLSAVGLLVYGPSAGIDMVVDEVKLVEISKEPTVVELYRADFESGARGWGPYFSTSLARSRRAREGNYSLVSYNRRYWYSGAGLDVNGLLQSGNHYQVSADVFLKSSQVSNDSAEFWLYIVDVGGARWIKLGGENLPVYSWEQLQVGFDLETKGAISQMRLHLFGPAPSTNIYLDNLEISQK